MRRRLRRGSAVAEHTNDEGPFVSFTDLFIGILFLFLILVAALMLMHQEAIREAQEEARRLTEQIAQIQAELDALNKLDLEHTPYRLAIVFNSYQKPDRPGAVWKFSRTVQLFRTSTGLCVENVILRNNLNLGWKPPVDESEIPTPDSQADLRTGRPCTLTAAGEHWDLETETGSVERVASNLYSGSTILHSQNGEQKIDIEYRVLGVYDDYYRSSGVRRSPAASDAQTEPDAQPPARSIQLN